MQMTVCLLRGLSMQSSLEEENGHEDQIIDMWISILTAKLSGD